MLQNCPAGNAGKHRLLFFAFFVIWTGKWPSQVTQCRGDVRNINGVPHHRGCRQEALELLPASAQCLRQHAPGVKTTVYATWQSIRGRAHLCSEQRCAMIFSFFVSRVGQRNVSRWWASSSTCTSASARCCGCREKHHVQKNNTMQCTADKQPPTLFTGLRVNLIVVRSLSQPLPSVVRRDCPRRFLCIGGCRCLLSLHNCRRGLNRQQPILAATGAHGGTDREASEGHSRR